MRNFFRLLFSLLALLSVPCYADDGTRMDGWTITTTGRYTRWGYSDWRETASGPTTASSTVQPGSSATGSVFEVMHEKGSLHAIGVEGTLSRGEYLLDWTAEVFGGLVAYDGSDILTGEPRKTIQAYVGTRETLTFNVKESRISAHFALNPFVGLEHRSLFKTTGPEAWNIFSARLGLRGSYRAASGHEFFGILNVDAPFVTVNHAFYLIPIGYADKDHFPSNHASFAAEIGVKFPKGRTISLSYEPYECGPSTPITTYKPFGNDTKVFYQPATKVRQVWVKVGKRF